MENKREFVYDFLRVLSCIFIIGIHCGERLIHGDNYNLLWWESNIFNAVVRTGLLLFVFISGALLLNKKPEKTSKFYLKRFTKILIPFLLYSYIYLWIDKYNFSFEMFLPNNMFSLLLGIIAEPSAYHLWFVYMILGIYLFVPYIKKMLQNLNDTECRNLFILLYLVSFIRCFLPSFGITVGITNLLIVDWILPFVLGYLLTKKNITSNYKLIYTLGILSFIFLIIAKRYFPNIKYLYDMAPTMLMQAQAVFVFFTRNREKICKNNTFNKIASFISKYCFEIYLIHVLVLDIMLNNIFAYVYFINPLINTLVAIILTFAFSFICTFIVHNLIVKYLLKGFNFIVENVSSHSNT